MNYELGIRNYELSEATSRSEASNYELARENPPTAGVRMYN